MSDLPKPHVIEAGQGPLTVLLHSGGAGAHQWRALMDDLRGARRLLAVNLFGYGETHPWRQPRLQTLEDQARLAMAALPDGDGPVTLVGHSLGGAVALKAAGLLGGRVDKLVLLEPSAFHLFKQFGRDRLFADCLEMRDFVKGHGDAGSWMEAAAWFIDYWVGEGAWAASSPERREKICQSLQPHYHEFDAILMDETPLEFWAETCPRDTLVVSAPDSTEPNMEVVRILEQHCPDWRFHKLPEGGHMAPVFRPDLVNPVVEAFLAEEE